MINDLFLTPCFVLSVWKADVPFPPVNCPKRFWPRKGGIDICQTDPPVNESTMQGQIWVAFLLSERGFYSNQLYQAPVNFRDINHSVINFAHATGDAMAKSFGSNSSTNRLDDDPVSFWLHCIDRSETPSVGDEQMRTLRTCCYRTEDGAANYSYGYLKQRTIKLLDNESFHRLCDFFGLEWMDEKQQKRSTTDPSLRDISAFFQQFDGTDLSTHAGLKDFITKFNLESRYCCDFSATVIENVARLGWLLRSFTNVRASVPDGQHRWHCLSSFIQGIMEASPNIPLQREYDNEKFDPNLKIISNWQCWKPMVFRLIGWHQTKPMTMMEICGQFRIRSEQLKNKKGIQSTFLHFLSLYSSELWNSKFDVLTMKESSFDQFWASDVPHAATSVSKNMCTILRDLEEMAAQDSTIIELIFGKRRDGFNLDSLKQIIGAAVKTWTMKKGGLYTTQGPQCKNWMVLCLLLKGICYKKDNLNVVPELHARQKFENQRHSMEALPMKMFTALDFWAGYLKGGEEVVDHLSQRLLIELKMLLCFRHSGNPSQIYHCLDRPLADDEWPKECNQAKDRQWVEPDNVTQAALGLRCFSIFKKMKDALVGIIISNMIRSLNTFGYDYKIFADEDVNLAVNLAPEEFFAGDNSTNYCLKLYLSKSRPYSCFEKFEYAGHKKSSATAFGESIRKCPKKPKKKKIKDSTKTLEISKYTSEIMASLYPYYVQDKHRVFERKLSWCRNMIGEYDESRGKFIGGFTPTETDSRNHASHGMPANCREFYPDLDAFQQPNVTMNDFYRDLMNGSFNTDTIPNFRAHVQLQCHRFHELEKKGNIQDFFETTEDTLTQHGNDQDQGFISSSSSDLDSEPFECKARSETSVWSSSSSDDNEPSQCKIETKCKPQSSLENEILLSTSASSDDSETSVFKIQGKRRALSLCNNALADATTNDYQKIATILRFLKEFHHKLPSSCLHIRIKQDVYNQTVNSWEEKDMKILKLMANDLGITEMPLSIKNIPICENEKKTVTVFPMTFTCPNPLTDEKEETNVAQAMEVDFHQDALRSAGKQNHLQTQLENEMIQMTEHGQCPSDDDDLLLKRKHARSHAVDDASIASKSNTNKKLKTAENDSEIEAGNNSVAQIDSSNVLEIVFVEPKMDEHLCFPADMADIHEFEKPPQSTSEFNYISWNDQQREASCRQLFKAYTDDTLKLHPTILLRVLTDVLMQETNESPPEDNTIIDGKLIRTLFDFSRSPYSPVMRTYEELAKLPESSYRKKAMKIVYDLNSDVRVAQKAAKRQQKGMQMTLSSPQKKRVSLPKNKIAFKESPQFPHDMKDPEEFKYRPTPAQLQPIFTYENIFNEISCVSVHTMFNVFQHQSLKLHEDILLYVLKHLFDTRNAVTAETKPKIDWDFHGMMFCSKSRQLRTREDILKLHVEGKNMARKSIAIWKLEDQAIKTPIQRKLRTHPAIPTCAERSMNFGII